MAKMQIAFYKGAQTLGGMLQDLLEDPGAFLTHVLICIRTLSKYSHAELVIDGKCWSSSEKDGGVRGKIIDLDSGHWDVYPVEWKSDDPVKALAWFLDHDGDHYDWMGVLRFVLPFVKQKTNEYFCSEAIAAALGAVNTDKLAPKDLLRFVVRT